jgi:hypothetical protein
VAACQVRIAQWALDPSTVAPGGQSELTLTLRNCTDRAISWRCEPPS